MGTVQSLGAVNCRDFYIITEQNCELEAHYYIFRASQTGDYSEVHSSLYHLLQQWTLPQN